MDARTKRAWTGLVNYANGIATDARVIRSTVADCIGWVSALAPFWGLGWISNDELIRQAAEYRPSVDGLLRFLCSGPKAQERNSLRSESLNFLFDHGQHIEGMYLTEVTYDEKRLQTFNYSQAELESFKEQAERIWNRAQYRRRDGQLTGEDWLPLGIRVPSRSYQDLADPICDFLMSEYGRYLDRFLAREAGRRDKELPPIVPIFVCPRCNRLVMPDRTGRKKYCSVCTDVARAEKYRQKAPSDESRDYQWLYRLGQKEPGQRKVFLRKRQNQERLKEIKIRQKKSSRCQRLILKMLL